MSSPDPPVRLGTLTPATRTALEAAGLDPTSVEQTARLTAAEDLALGPDVTTLATVPAGAVAVGDVVARSAGVIAGLAAATAVLDIMGDNQLTVTALRRDGETVSPGDAVLRVSGPTRALLTSERSMLNILCRLAGVATLTRCWVEAVAGTGVVVRDTRKTTPGLRSLEKYAVRCGGGQNHRMALGDQALIKDNHIAAAGGVRAAFERVRALAPDITLEVECDTVEQVREAIAAGATLVLLDNMDLDHLRAAVAVARTAGAAGTVRLEASGRLSLDRARVVAETGVDYLAVGALTHSAPILDLGFDLQP